jgi:NADH-quinone oxidoreductase subunit M
VRSGQFFTSNNIVDILSALVVPGIFAIGEFMVIVASFQKHPYLALTAASTLIIGAAYTLWLVKRVMYGEVANAHVAEMKDLNGREVLVLGVFAVGVLAIGIWPKPLTDLMEPAIAQLAAQLAHTKL